ncbi:MAG: hypothetical protein RR317_01090 [Bilophila sp.]
MSAITPSAPPYTVDEVLENFAALLESMDFAQELALLGIRRFHFRHRQKAFRELRALYIGVWRLALLRSFPEEAEQIFATFLATLLDDAAPDKNQRAKLFDTLVHSYVDMLHERGDADFTFVSGHIINLFKHKNEDTIPRRLKLALLIRNTYTVIFHRLI